jgi:S1-C subfamily serine protease
MTRRSLWAIILLLTVPAAAQLPLFRLSVQVILVDKDLNQKPVPKLVLVITKLDAAPGQETTIKTGFNGIAETRLPPGKYRVTTPQPTEFQGKRYRWEQEIVLTGAEQTLELSNDNAITSAVSSEPSTATASGDLTALFERLKNSVVQVTSEAGQGSGFLIDRAGLVLTNHHVVESSTYLAVQFDQKRKVPARLLAASPDKDVAVLWVNLSAFPQAVVLPLAPADAAPVVVGQRVFTIGNPMGREKALTTGVISKVEAQSITSDININHGNSGGPLLTLEGRVIGITTAGLQKLASIVPIADAQPLIVQARGKLAGASPPPADLLPVEPAEYFPADSLRALLQIQKLDTKPYFFDVGEFEVGFTTPILTYFDRHADEMAAARKEAKRGGGDASQAKPSTGTLEEAKEYHPVLLVAVWPKLHTFWRVRFKNGFQRMRLLCGGKEVTPINPGRNPFALRDERGRTMDTTYEGNYMYLPDAVSPACGNVVVEIFSEKDPNVPVSKPVDAATIERVWADFEPYRKAHAAAQTSVPAKD